MIKIMADSACDLPKGLAAELGIEILPFMITIGDKSVRADENLDPDDFYAMVKESDEIPSTCQMSPNEVEDRYRKLCEGGNSVIHISISANGSGIYNTSCLVASQLQEEGLDITVVDSTMFSYPIGHGVIAAANMAKEGKSKEEILDFLTELYKRDTAYFMVDDLSYLQKGGRIKATTMVIGSILDIKPILNINDGLVEAYKKVRGLKKALATLVDYAVERMDSPEENEIYILHSDAPDKAEIIQKMIEEKVKPKKICIGKIGPIITSHAGLGVVGIYFKHKMPYENYDKN